jgi:PAS domain S-box-containing protein
MKDLTNVKIVPMWESAGTGEKVWLESEMCHRQMLRSLPVAVYTCDAKGRVTFFNRAAVKLWGREPELYKDLWCGSWKIYNPDGTPMALDKCPMSRTIREGRSIQGEEIMIERPDGTRRRVLPYPEPIRNSLGAVVGAVNTLVDLTETHSVEELPQPMFEVLEGLIPSTA